MPIELERKFLVLNDRLPALTGGDRLIQGYMSEEPQIRFRITGSGEAAGGSREAAGGARVVIAIKKFLETGKRMEFEFARDNVSPEEIRDLQTLALWPPLVKTRYRVPHAGFVWEIDVYDGANKGLITCEVEVPSLDHPLDLPDWVNPNGEITGDMRYSNIELTRKPFRDWGHP
jgi:CYTH domain-containing protein